MFNHHEHELIVPFDSTQNLRYMFLTHQIMGATPLDNHVKLKALHDMKILCNQNKYKKEKLMEIIKSIISKGEKAVVFTRFEKTTQSLSEFLDEFIPYRYRIISGTLKQSLKTNLTEFNDSDSLSVLLSTDVLLGYSLRNVTNVIHYDYPDSYNVLLQRTHRVDNLTNKDKNKNIYYLMSEDKIDHKMYNVLKKQKEAMEHLQH